MRGKGCCDPAGLVCEDGIAARSHAGAIGIGPSLILGPSFHRTCTSGSILLQPESGGRLPLMTSSMLRKEILRLSTAEKLELVEEIWDSIPGDDEALPPTPEQRADLDRRLAEADADPNGGVPWEEARERIRQRQR